MPCTVDYELVRVCLVTDALSETRQPDRMSVQAEIWTSTASDQLEHRTSCPLWNVKRHFEQQHCYHTTSAIVNTPAVQCHRRRYYDQPPASKYRNSCSHRRCLARDRSICKESWRAAFAIPLPGGDNRRALLLHDNYADRSCVVGHSGSAPIILPAYGLMKKIFTPP